MAKRMRKLLVTPHRKFSQTFVTGKKSTLYSVRSYVYCVGRWDLRFSRTELINKNNFSPSLFSYYMLNLFLPSRYGYVEQ